MRVKAGMRSRVAQAGRHHQHSSGDDGDDDDDHDVVSDS